MICRICKYRIFDGWVFGVIGWAKGYLKKDGTIVGETYMRRWVEYK